jgi:hypothetical protein
MAAYSAAIWAVPEIFWWGVHLSDRLDFPAPEECLLLLAERKRKMLQDFIVSSMGDSGVCSFNRLDW